MSKAWTVYETPSLGSLVVPSGNSQAPIHRWFHLKEAYSKDLVPSVVSRLGLAGSDRPLIVADPFSGVGTSLLSAVDMVRGGQLASMRGHGLEVNPFLHFVSSVKLRAATAAAPQVLEVRNLLDAARRLTIETDALPSLSTFQNRDYFPEHHVRQLVQLRRAIDSMGLEEDARGIARMALAMTIEPAGRLRRDGRALRYEERNPLQPFKVFPRALERLTEDLSHLRSIDADVEVVHGSAAESRWKSVQPDSVDLVIFSPPYPNNIDYTEVYKTELWAMGYIEDRQQFLAQRHSTLRSHPSVKFTRPLSYAEGSRSNAVKRLLEPLLSSISSDSRYALPLERMICGYADDMLTTFDAAYSSLRPGGACVYVVGNSVHGGTDNPLMIASDVLLGALAELAGFAVGEVHVARRLPRRRIQSDYVRESLVVLCKPD